MIWFTSDLHLGHDKDFIWQARGFSSVEEMNEEIVRRWNEVVGSEDSVYVLGDLVVGNLEEGLKYLSKLNGFIHIIRGNHDTMNKIVEYFKIPQVIERHEALEIKYKKAYFWLSHYPAITANCDDDKPWAKHLINLFGHTHQQTKFYEMIKHAGENPYMYNVGVDAHNCTPVSIDQIIEDIRKKKEELNNG